MGLKQKLSWGIDDYLCRWGLGVAARSQVEEGWVTTALAAN